jgi:ABC-2 type transport system ATP-binding protein
MLRLSGVRKSFGPVVAVEGLSLEIVRGEVFGLLGPNGAGKTTTIRMAVGQLRPDAGTVDLDGRGSPTDPAVRQQIGVAPQTLALYDELSGEENLTFFGRLYGLRGGALKQRVTHLLAFVGLTERRRHRVSTYSGGMKRRLNLAVALVHEPALVLLDEPTAGVDPQSRSAIFDLVRTLQGEGRTVVYTTHYMEEAQRLCDRVGIMDHGRLLALDTVAKLIAMHGRRSTVVTERADGAQRIETADPKTELAGLLQDPSVLRAHVEQADLESVFLALTGRSLRD